MSQSDLFRVWPTIVADNPWPYEDAGIRGGVDHHYPTLSIAQIVAMPIWRYCADAAHLYLWITNAHLLEGTGAMVCRAWGFEPKTVITWDKWMMGTGHYFRNQTEHVIFAARKNARLLRADLPTMLSVKRSRKHSEKPPEFYELVEQASPGPFLELFARQQRGAGWSCWGNELAEPVALPELDDFMAVAAAQAAFEKRQMGLFG